MQEILTCFYHNRRHISEIVKDGVLADLWNKLYSYDKDIDCEDVTGGSLRNRKLLRFNEDGGTSTAQFAPSAASSGANTASSTTSAKTSSAFHRVLSSVTKGGSVTAYSTVVNNSSSMTVQQMLGTFVFHWIAMAVAVAIAAVTKYYKLHLKKHDKLPQSEEAQTVHAGNEAVASDANLPSETEESKKNDQQPSQLHKPKDLLARQQNLKASQRDLQNQISIMRAMLGEMQSPRK